MRECRSDDRAGGVGRQPIGGIFRRFRRNERGATAVGFAILAMPFFLVVFSILEVALLFMAELTLDQAVDRIGRQVRTGQLDTADMTKEKFRAKLCAELVALIPCSGLQLDLRAYDTYGTIDPAPPADGNYSSFGWQRGGPDQIMALRAYYSWPLVTNFLRAGINNSPGILLASVTAFRTEKY